MEKRLTMLLVGLFLLVGGAFSQTKVSGTVVSQDDMQPVIGASVLVVGTTTGTVTNAQGKFTLTVPEGKKTLRISYVGMETLEVSARPNMKIVLTSDQAALDEVIVVAYGTAKKSAFTGAATQLDESVIGRRQVSSALDALSGAASGVQVTQYTGQPGSDPTIRVRGIGSLSASSNPLYVVDGVPYDGKITSINPADIESMSVLKDASASAIYGARGANGVVIITTKTAKRGQEAKVTFDARWGSNSRGVPNYDVLSNAGDYYEKYYRALYNERFYSAAGGDVAAAHAYANSNLYSNLGAKVYTVPAGETLIGTNFKLNPNATLGYKEGNYYYTPDDWYDEMYNTGNLRQEYNATVSGSNERMTYYMSLGMLDEKGIINSSNYRRYTGRLSADYQAKEWLKVGANMGYAFEKQGSPTSQNAWGSSGNSFYVADNIAPIYPLYVRNADGSNKIDDMGITVMDTGTNTPWKRKFSAGNPLIDLSLNSYNLERSSINSKAYALIDLPLEGLRFNTNVNANVYDIRENNLYNPYYGASSSSGGSVNVNHYRRIGINSQFLLTYQHSFGDHNVDVLAGHENYHMKYQQLETAKQKLYLGDAAELDNAISYPSAPTSNTVDYATLGWLFRAQYNYQEKYFASVSYRRDASSRFADGHKWGNFGSFGAAWLISKEAFMESTQSWLNELKLKASIGSQGNDALMYDGELNYYPAEDRYKVSDVNGTPVPVFDSYKGNRDITWETSISTNLGIEFSLFKNRLSGSIEYYNRTTKDMLYYRPVAVSMGYDSYPVNEGSMYNRGVEIQLNGVVYKDQNISVELNANLTTLKNKITSYPTVMKGSMLIREEGGSIYESYLRSYAGVWHGDASEYSFNDKFDKSTLTLGDALYYCDPDEGDYNVTNVYTDAKQAHQGSTAPKAYGGFGLNATAYGFDLSMQFAYQLGGKLYDHKYQGLMSSNGGTGHNWSTDIADAWSPENPYSNVPRIDTGVNDSQDDSDRFLISSNYLSLNNVTLGYTLPKNLVQKMGIASLRVYVAGDNLALWSKRKGLDPRRSLTMGVTTLGGGYSDTYAALKTISGGISVTF
jgi:TonB-linked SusC/RagA family outer membrane protein